MLSPIRIFYILSFSCLILPFNSPAQDDRFGIMERTGAVLPADLMLTNEDSVTVKFGDLIDRPTLLSFVYYECPGLCSPVMNGIAEIIEKSDLVLGRDYQVLTISIDYKEGISLARAKKATYLKTMQKSGAQEYWRFFVADSTTVKTLTDATGWQYKRAGNDFVHSAGTIMITPRRRISQYFYGTFILPMHFHMAVNDARHEVAEASRIKDQKYCYNFVPPVNRTYSLIISSAGIGILLFAVILFIFLTLTPRPSHHNTDT